MMQRGKELDGSSSTNLLGGDLVLGGMTRKTSCYWHGTGSW